MLAVWLPFVFDPKQTRPYIFRSPHFDCAVLGGRVEKSVSSPLHTGDRLGVSCQNLLTASQDRVPDAQRAVLRTARQVATLWVTEKKEEQKYQLNPTLYSH